MATVISCAYSYVQPMPKMTRAGSVRHAHPLRGIGVFYDFFRAQFELKPRLWTSVTYKC
jgi:hypothetical protein